MYHSKKVSRPGDQVLRFVHACVGNKQMNDDFEASFLVSSIEEFDSYLAHG